MKTLRFITCLTLLLTSSVFYCKGLTSLDSITVTIKVSDEILMKKAPQLNLQRLGEEERIKIDPISIDKNVFRFKFVNQNFFECVLSFKEAPSRIMLFFLSPECKELKLEWECQEGVSPFGFVTKSAGSKADSDHRRYKTNIQQMLSNIDQQLTNKYPDYQKNYHRQDIANERTVLKDLGNYQMMNLAFKNNSYYPPILYWHLMKSFDSWNANQLKILLNIADPGAGLYYKKRIETDLLKKEVAMKGEESRKVLLNNITLNQAIKVSNKKIIYLSLWASWCAPCRGHNKTLLKGNFKNVEVIAISFDKNTPELNKAIVADGIGKWKQVQLVKGFNSEIANTYNINALPGNIILNEKREIIGINITDEQLLLLL